LTANNKKLLIFGARGAIGGAVGGLFAERRWDVAATTRKLEGKGGTASSLIQFDPFGQIDVESVHASGPYDAVCWAQGANVSDNIYTVDQERHLELYRANCLFPVLSLKWLLAEHLLVRGSRLCVVSSIWQNLARQDKLSYCMTKSALQGFVLSASTELAKDEHLVNAILPGPLDTPMTRENLKPDQLERITAATMFNRLPRLEDVARLAYFLCSDDNTGITGQFIAADLGFSRVRLI